MKMRDRHSSKTNGVPPLLLVGVAIQAVGIGTQALFHLSGGRLPWLTERRTSAIDHTLSNAGVLCLVSHVGRWLRSGTAWSNAGRRFTTIGTAVEAVGAAADGVGHALGGEHRLPLLAIVAGYATILAGGALSALDAGRSSADRPSRCARRPDGEERRLS